MLMRRLKIPRGGQLSIPAEIRRRWDTGTLALEDLGDHVVLRPTTDDPVAAARGALAGRVPRTEELRRRARADETAAEGRWR
jgi:hypothetical protein